LTITEELEILILHPCPCNGRQKEGWLLSTCSEESHGAGRSDGTEVRVVLEEILLQFGKDVLPVCVLPQGRDVRPEHRNTADKTSYFYCLFLEVAGSVGIRIRTCF
jgi:hypothetical protein